MERLKAILADKILDLTSSGGDDVKAKIDKMHRFRDFANACQTLMVKYPAIEDELIKMVNDGDFDTKVASSRVDSVIRIADRETVQPQVPETNVIQEPEEKLITEENEVSNLPLVEEEEPVYQPEDIDFEVVSPSLDDDVEKGYVPFENVDSNIPSGGIILETETDLTDEELAAAKRKKTIRMVVQILGILLIVALLIIAIKFVMTYWVTILIVLGVALIILILVWLLRRKRS